MAHSFSFLTRRKTNNEERMMNKNERYRIPAHFPFFSCENKNDLFCIVRTLRDCFFKRMKKVWIHQFFHICTRKPPFVNWFFASFSREDFFSWNSFSSFFSFLIEKREKKRETNNERHHSFIHFTHTHIVYIYIY